MIYLQWNTHILIQSVLTYVYIPNQKIGQPVPILIHKVSPYLTRRSPFKVAPVSFEMSPLFFEHFLTFWHKMFQILLVLCLPNFEISHFSKDSWFLLTWDGIQKSRYRPLLCFLLLACQLLLDILDGQLGKYMDVYIKYMDVHTQRHKYLCTYTSVTTCSFFCVYVCIYEV